jgi:hypothetical protein
MRAPLNVFSRIAGLLLLLYGSLASAAGLMDMLTGGLGVTQPQAEGGVGALMDVAKTNLAPDDYSTLIAKSPDLAVSAAGAAAKSTAGGSSGLGGMLQGATALMGDSGSVGQAAQLAQAFDQLGLSPDMVGQFGQVVLDYVQQTGGTQMMQMLSNALPL